MTLRCLRCLRCSAPLPVPEKVEADTIVRCGAVYGGGHWDAQRNEYRGQACMAKHLLRPGPDGKVNVLMMAEKEER